MGTSSATASVSQAGIRSIMIGYRGEKNGRESFVCDTCGRGQFNRGQDACVACHQPFIIFLEPLEPPLMECDAKQVSKACSAESICARLKGLRIVLGISQSELADAAGCTRSYISKYECYMTVPGLTSLYRLTAALNVGLGELLDDDQSVNDLAVLVLAREELLRELIPILPFLGQQTRDALLAAARGESDC